MRTLFIAFIIGILTSCNDSTELTTPTITSDLATGINTRDTCLRILRKYAIEDTFVYERFFEERTFIDGNFSYVRTGPLIYPGKKNGIIIYTPTDSTVAVELYSYRAGSWTLLDKKTDLPQNGMNFYTNITDYNFDGIGDIYINVTASNGFGLCTGHLLTVTETGSFVLHPETSEIQDMMPDITSHTINAHKGLYCLDSNYVCDEQYKWINNRLVRTSLPCDCPDS